MTKKKNQKEKSKIKKTNRKCPLCKNNTRTYTNSAF